MFPLRPGGIRIDVITRCSERLSNTKSGIGASVRLKEGSLFTKRRVSKQIAALNDPDPLARAAAAGNLGSEDSLEGQIAADVISALANVAYQDDSEKVRKTAFKSLTLLSKLGRRGDGLNRGFYAAAIPVLVDALRGDDMYLRFDALVALEASGPEAAGAVPALMDALQHESETVRERAARTLACIGPAASVAIPAITEVFNADLRDSDEIVRHNATHYLGVIARWGR